MNSSAQGTPAFQITIQPSGRTFSATPGETLLASAIRQGIGMPYGCKDGACGACKCKKLEGEVTHAAHQSKALSPEEAADGFVLTCCASAHSNVVLESRQVTQEGAFPVKKLPTRVSVLEKKSPDVMRLKLQLPANDGFAFHAGQYIDFILRDGVRRSYSMANAPHTVGQPGGGIELHIRHMPGGKFTDHVFTTLKEKEILRIEGPYGSFYLREDSQKPIVLLASGTGFAPIKAIIEQLQFKGIERPVSLYWGARRPADLYMDDWVKAQQSTSPWLHYIPVVSDAQAHDGWTGRTGFVRLAGLQDRPDLSGHQVYACGAPVVVNAAQSAYTTQAGLPADAFFADAFTSEADKACAP